MKSLTPFYFSLLLVTGLYALFHYHFHIAGLIAYVVINLGLVVWQRRQPARTATDIFLPFFVSITFFPVLLQYVKQRPLAMILFVFLFYRAFIDALLLSLRIKHDRHVPGRNADNRIYILLNFLVLVLINGHPGFSRSLSMIIVLVLNYLLLLRSIIKQLTHEYKRK